MISIDNLMSLLSVNNDTSTTKPSSISNDGNVFESLLSNCLSDAKSISNKKEDFSDVNVKEIGVTDVTIESSTDTSDLISKLDSIITEDTSKEDISKILYKLGSIVASLNISGISVSQNNIALDEDAIANNINVLAPIDSNLNNPTAILSDDLKPILEDDKINSSNSENMVSNNTNSNNTNSIKDKLDKEKESIIEKEIDALLVFLNSLQNINSIPPTQNNNSLGSLNTDKPSNSSIQDIINSNSNNSNTNINTPNVNTNTPNTNTNTPNVNINNPSSNINTNNSPSPSPNTNTNTNTPNTIGPITNGENLNDDLNSNEVSNNDLNNDGIPDDVHIFSDSIVDNKRVIISDKPFDISSLSKLGTSSDIDTKLDSIVDKLDKVLDGDKKIISDFLEKLTKVLNKDSLSNTNENKIITPSDVNKKEENIKLDNNLEISSIINTSAISSHIESVTESKDIHPVASQIFDILQAHMSKSEGEDKLTNIRLKLFPAKLGNVNIELDTVGKSVNIKMYADNEYAKEVLQGSIRDLLASFNNKDVNVSNINVFVGADQQNQQQQSNNPQNNYANLNYLNNSKESSFDFDNFYATQNISERLLDIKI